jgi:hypothetical protein
MMFGFISIVATPLRRCINLTAVTAVTTRVCGNGDGGTPGGTWMAARVIRT